MVIGADEGRVRVRACHERSGCAVAAADIGDARTRAELGVNAIEGGQPTGQEIGRIPRPEEALTARKHLMMVLVPAESRASPERLGDLWFGAQRRQRELKRAGRVDSPVRVGRSAATGRPLRRRP